MKQDRQPHKALPAEITEQVLRYCDRDLARDEVYERSFDFIDDIVLRERLIKEVKSARYIYKLMSALGVAGSKLEAHLKFQVTQYASIYESIICHLLWTRFKDSPQVRALEVHKVYKKVCELPKTLEISYDDEPVFFCSLRDQKTSIMSIKFDDKVDAAVSLGLLGNSLAEEIKQLYKLRNSIHIESAVKHNTAFELEQARIAYMRLQPFTQAIRKCLQAKPVPKKDLAKLAIESKSLSESVLG